MDEENVNGMKKKKRINYKKALGAARIVKVTKFRSPIDMLGNPIARIAVEDRRTS